MSYTNAAPPSRTTALTVLILQYNSADLTIQLLESIEQKEHQQRENYRFILMDNASADNKFSQIQQRFPWIELIEHQENLGFGRAHNRAMPLIDSDWILLLNNDCILLNDAISRTLNESIKRNADFATCAVKNKNLTDQVNFSTLPTPLRRIFLNYTGLTRLLWIIRRKKNSSRVGYINGAFLLIKRTSIPDAQLFDDRYFMYTEDLDLMYRLHKNNAKGYRFSSGRAIHLGGGSAVRKWTGGEINDKKQQQNRECMLRHFPHWQTALLETVQRTLLLLRLR